MRLIPRGAGHQLHQLVQIPRSLAGWDALYTRRSIQLRRTLNIR